MSNLLATLISSANALSAFERGLVVSQNNVANATTPGYASQRLSLAAAEFEPNLGLIGGVRAGDIESSRNLYAEQAVRRQTESLGYFEQAAQSLASIESSFDVSGDQGIPGALNKLFDSVSAWGLEPNSATARQFVIDSAGDVAEAFHQTSAALSNASTDADLQLRQIVDKINELGTTLVECNAECRRSGLNDAGLDTRIQNTIEELSKLVNVTSLYGSDGSVTVLIGGQTPLLVGENLYKIHLSYSTPADTPAIYPAAPPPARIMSAEGQDITQQIDQGRLGGLLDVRNEVLPSLGGGAYQAGDLNVLAKAIADRVNTILTAGRISDGPPPEAGVPLFSYDTTNDTSIAASLSLDPGISASKLAAISPGPPYTSNGTALQLAALADPHQDADKIQGYSFVEFYGRVAGRVGSRLEDARQNQDFKTQMVAQAKSLRADLSGVSLDEEAIHIIEFQRAYQANARVVSVLSELTRTAIDLFS